MFVWVFLVDVLPQTIPQFHQAPASCTCILPASLGCQGASPGRQVGMVCFRYSGGWHGLVGGDRVEAGGGGAW